MVRTFVKWLFVLGVLGGVAYWVSELISENGALEVQAVSLPWLPMDAQLTVIDGVGVGAAAGALAGIIFMCILVFSGSKRTSMQKMRRQVDKLRQQLAEARAEVDVLKSRGGRAVELALPVGSRASAGAPSVLPDLPDDLEDEPGI
jgi:hypothetical protein